MRRWQPIVVIYALLLRATTARRRGALRPHAKAQTRTGRTVYYEVVKSKPRQPGDRHNQWKLPTCLSSPSWQSR